MKKELYISVIIVATAWMTSCQRMVIEDAQYGVLSVSVENSPVEVIETKADDDEGTVSVDDFSVTIASATNSYSYIYGEMPSSITLPVGSYNIHAENVTLEESLTQPDKWGQKRFAGDEIGVAVSGDGSVANATVNCTMVNSALSVIFDQTVQEYFSSYSLSVSSDESRKLVFDSSNSWNSSDRTGAIAYFESSVSVSYSFIGTPSAGGDDFSTTGSFTLQPANHLFLTIKVRQTEDPQAGSVGKPSITVDQTCDDLYDSITVDPSEGGSTITE
ncbi:MAG: DUF4493 domain-containing protein [Candidatus Cryptobacteroides sp.]